MIELIIVIFILGYAAIAFEGSLRIHKAASALVTGVLCWVVSMFSGAESGVVNENLLRHVGDIASILFFCWGRW